MSIWSLTYQQSVFKRYHSGKHFSGFLPTRWRQNSTGIDMKQSYVTVAPCIVKVKITTTGNTDNAFDCCRVERQKLRILTLPVEHAVRGLCNGRVSVRPSVCSVNRQQQRRPTSLLLSAGGISRSMAGTPAPHAGSVMLRAEVRGSTHFIVIIIDIFRVA